MLRIGGPRRKSITSNGLSGSLEEPSLAAIIGLTYRSGPFISARSTPRSRSCGTAFGKVGSKLPCGGAAPHLQRYCTWSPPSEDASQPNHDVHAGRSAGSAARARGFPRADLRVRSADQGDAEIIADVSEAQETDFAVFCKHMRLAAHCRRLGVPWMLHTHSAVRCL